MKRKVWFILLVFAFFTIPVFSEEENIQSSYEVETPDGEVGELKVYKLLKWKKEVNSVKYRVQIEKDNNGTWESVYDAEHEETSIEVALTPGRHRVAITGMNIIGRLGKQEPKWRETVVITDDQPYLDSKYMKKNPDWNYPVLMVTQAEDEVVTDVVIPEAGDPENSFSVKGKNIFFTDTKFYLEPEDKPSKGGKEFLAYNKLRVSVPLEVIRNDHENNSVVLKYNGDKLNTGYYQIVAENRGGKKSALDILVFANRSPVLDTKSFTYYPNYEVNLFDAQKVNEEGILKLYGTGYTSDTEYSLTPSTAGIPYPFATMTERETIPLTVASSRTLDYVGNMEISLSVPQKIRPGYYNISAQNKMGRDSQLVLVKDLDQQITSPLINSISAEVTKKSEYITITLKGKEISANTVYSIVSQFSEETGNNLHIPLTVVDLKRGGKKVILQGKKEKLTEGDYGLLIETPSHSFVKYFHINPKFKTSFVTLSDDETVEKFIRPENFVAVVKTVQEDGTEIVEEVKSVVTENELEYSPFDFKVLRKSKMLFPYIVLDLNLGPNPFNKNGDNNMLMGASLGAAVLNLDWLRVGVNFDFFPFDNVFGAGGYFHIATPTFYVRPFVGLGAGVNWYPDNSRPFQMYAFARGGIVLLDYFDFKYTLYLNDISNLMYNGQINTSNKNLFMYEVISLGVRIPVQAPIYIQKPIHETLTITKSGKVSGKDYEIKSNVKKIVFANGVTEITGFEEMPLLEEVSLPDSIKIIGEKAFANCEKLSKINLPEGLEEIGENAFENCINLKVLELPTSILKVSESAISGWRNYQYITYNWGPDDPTERSLGSLAGNKNFRRKGFLDTETPLNNPNLFTSDFPEGVKTNIAKSKLNTNGITTWVYNFQIDSTGAAKDMWADMIITNPDAISTLMDSQGIKFHCKGDGKKYKIQIKQGEDYIYTYEFTSGYEDKVITVPFNKFIYADFSKQKKKIPVSQMTPDQINIGISDWIRGKYQISIWGIEPLLEGEK